ncbi:D-glycero-beta-D-manno-heptose 1-phosphate adenylyltransferase [Thauera aromatica]|uniref:D-glycero-beta-D-manno-heptose 1-phosphate adenylyltransferase n=1 Tax=Thauera aromatica TaxID=59405 RepID=UPI001FFCF53D|nr:D-glycero-beta-D-manno-heptose 1-phosphate adenylyltransferase [Thauera aromatica]MCK2088228.1 D-glycero-beta-D-manno-heptose 1-phosphate adenylyltransferase [Thauera aromatica]
MTFIAQYIDKHLAAVAALRASEPAVAAAAQRIGAAINRGNTLLLCGNGGSAADAQHIAAELVGRFVAERRGLPAIALTTDTSILTAVGNDYGYDSVFARQVEALARPGDVVVGISTSGNSPNVIAAMHAARARGCELIGLLGRDGGRLRDLVDVAVTIGVAETAHIQECHIMVGHIWCAHVDAHLAAAGTVGGDRRSGVLGEAEAVAAVRAAREAGARVVMTNGCFDILHPGHIEYLEQARALGDRLIVAVNDDDSVRRLKGERRPVNPLAHRLRMLAALGCVDWVVPFAEDTPERLICAVLPDVLVKGGDYTPEQIAGGDCVRRAGGEVKVLGFVPGHSTSGLIEKIRG